MSTNHNIFLVAQHKGDRERSVDILSLQSEFENSYLNKIMPEISVLTVRFRYMSFICWAILNNIDLRSEDFRLLEDALAKTEYKLSLQGKEVGSYKGSRNIKDTDPHYYVQSVFGDYRNTMEGLGLLKPDNKLTDDGKRMAECFTKIVGKVPRNVTGAAHNGFTGVKTSLLSLSKEEKRKYQDLFEKGGKKDEAKYRKKYAPLYRKLIKQSKYEIDYEVDNTKLALLQKVKTDHKIKISYPVALAMFNYMYVVFCFVKAMHCIYNHIAQGQDGKISLADAAARKDIKRHLGEGLTYNQ